jgi:hypothetical protein
VHRLQASADPPRATRPNVAEQGSCRGLGTLVWGSIFLALRSQEYSSQFQALAQVYLNSNLGATCFADETGVLDLMCHAILMTGGAGISGPSLR